MIINEWIFSNASDVPWVAAFDVHATKNLVFNMSFSESFSIKKKVFMLFVALASFRTQLRLQQCKSDE